VSDQATQLRELAERLAVGSVPAPTAPPSIEPRRTPSIPASPVPAPPRSRQVMEVSANAPRLARAIAVTSGKGGVGKSNLSVNLAVCLARQGLRVCLLDADLGMANADVLCGLAPTHTLEDVVKGDRRLSEVVVPAPGGFTLVPGASGVGRLANLQVAEQHRLVEQLGLLERTVDLVVVDTGAGVGTAVTSFVAAAAATLVVVTPEPTSMTDAYGAIKVLAADLPHARPRLVVNQVTSMAEARDVHARIDRVSRRYLGRGVAFAGAVPADPALQAAVRRQRPLTVFAPDAPAAKAIESLASSLGVEFREASTAVESPVGDRGFLQRLAGWIRRDR